MASLECNFIFWIVGVFQMKNSYLALAAASLAAFAMPAQAANLLTNGSFESGLSGWTLGGGSGDGYPPAAISYGAPGSAFGEVVPADNAAGNPGFDAVGLHGVYFVADLANPQTLSQIVNIAAGESYTVGFDVYLPGNGAANINDATFTASIGGDEFATFNASSQPAQQWMHYSSSGIATVSGPLEFKFDYNSFGIPAKDFVVDRVYFAITSSVPGVPEPSTWAMLVLGFGAIGFAARRRTAVSFA